MVQLDGNDVLIRLAEVRDLVLTTFIRCRGVEILSAGSPDALERIENAQEGDEVWIMPKLPELVDGAEIVIRWVEEELPMRADRHRHWHVADQDGKVTAFAALL